MKKRDLIKIYIYQPRSEWAGGIYMSEKEIIKNPGWSFVDDIHILKDDWEHLSEGKGIYENWYGD